MKLTDSFYYQETRGLCGRKVLREINQHGPTKVRLYAYESWPKPALISSWMIQTVWWSKTKCRIREQQGHRISITKGQMKCLGDGRLEIRGQFYRHTDAFFRLVLSSRVTDDDIFNRYILSGDLELGDTEDSMQLSHLAVVKFEQNQSPENSQVEHYYDKLRRFFSFACLD